MPGPFKETFISDLAAAIELAQPTWKIQDVPQLATTASQTPTVTLDLVSIERQSGSPTETTYTYTVNCTVRAAYPASGNITDAKIATANQLYAALIGNAALNAVSYGTLQDVPTVEFSETETLPAGSRAYEVTAVYVISITGER